MLTRVSWIDGPWPGRLAILPRPRGGDWLRDEMAGWRDAGVDVVVSLLESEEATELGLDDEGDAALASGLAFLSLAIPDRGIPASSQATPLVRDIIAALDQGKNVAVHCRQGIGRSGLIAGAVLVTASVDLSTALRRLSEARGVEVPETIGQRQWLEGFASACEAARDARS